MDLGLKNQVALIAAGTRGIGLASALSLQAEGVKVSVCGVSEGNLNKAREILGAGALVTKCDLTKRSEIESWVRLTQEKLGPISILMTNTGGPEAGAPSTLTDEKWVRGFESTLLNVTRMVELVLPDMKKARAGRIIHLTSLVAKEPSTVLTISSTLRAGLSALTRLQAEELGPLGITVNAVLPGHTLTDRQTHLLEIQAGKLGVSVDQAREKSAEKIPLRRMAEPHEIGDVICFLASKKASYVSGSLVVVDGGITRGLG